MWVPVVIIAILAILGAIVLKMRSLAKGRAELAEYMASRTKQAKEGAAGGAAEGDPAPAAAGSSLPASAPGAPTAAAPRSSTEMPPSRPRQADASHGSRAPASATKAAHASAASGSAASGAATVAIAAAPAAARAATATGVAATGVAAAAGADPHALRPSIERLLEDRAARIHAQHQLHKAGAAAADLLLAALKDPRFTATLEEDLHMPAWTIAAELLAEVADPRLIDAVRGAATSSDARARAAAALALGVSGLDSACELVAPILDDAESTVRRAACHGVVLASRHARLGRQLRDLVVKKFTEQLRADPARHIDAIEAIAVIAPSVARTLLEEDPLLSRDPLAAAHAMAALHAIGARPDAARVEQVMEKWRSEGEKASSIVVAGALHLLVDARSKSAQACIEAALQSADPHLRDAGADASPRLSGLPGLKQIGSKALKDAHASKQARLVGAIVEWHAAMKHGGFEHYLAQSVGDHWKMALEGLEALEAVVSADLLRRAVNLLGTPEGLSRRDARLRILGELSAEQRRELHELGATVERDEDGVMPRLAKWVVAHRARLLAG